MNMAQPDELTAASEEGIPPAGRRRGSRLQSRGQAATELQPAGAPGIQRWENAPPHGQSGSGASAQAGTKSVAVFGQARNLKPLFGPDPKIPGWLGTSAAASRSPACTRGASPPAAAWTRVNVLLSIPSADEDHLSTLRTWQFPLLSSPLCIIKEFRFEPRD